VDSAENGRVALEMHTKVAADGAILIDGGICSAIAARLPAYALGAVVFKGKADLVDVFVLGERAKGGEP
jgi:hypothetical protein